MARGRKKMRARSAISGRFVKIKTAIKNPATTVIQAIKRRRRRRA